MRALCRLLPAWLITVGAVLGIALLAAEPLAAARISQLLGSRTVEDLLSATLNLVVLLIFAVGSRRSSQAMARDLLATRANLGQALEGTLLKCGILSALLLSLAIALMQARVMAPEQALVLSKARDDEGEAASGEAASGASASGRMLEEDGDAEALLGPNVLRGLCFLSATFSVQGGAISAFEAARPLPNRLG